MDTTPAFIEEFDDHNKKELIKRMAPNLRLITGGGEPPAKTGNWLKDMEVGTVFFTIQSVNPMTGQMSKDFNLQLFRLEGKEGTHQNVVCIRSPLLPKEIYVDPGRFCAQFSLHHTIGVMAFPEPNNKEEENVEGHWSTPPDGEKKEDVVKSD